MISVNVKSELSRGKKRHNANEAPHEEYFVLKIASVCMPLESQ